MRMVALLDIDWYPDTGPTVCAPFQNSFSDSLEGARVWLLLLGPGTSKDS